MREPRGVASARVGGWPAVPNTFGLYSRRMSAYVTRAQSGVRPSYIVAWSAELGAGGKAPDSPGGSTLYAWCAESRGAALAGAAARSRISAAAHVLQTPRLLPATPVDGFDGRMVGI